MIVFRSLSVGVNDLFIRYFSIYRFQIAKHYSVTPLGAHSGLISWVDGMTPIFVLYKKWQQRQAANPKKEKLGQTPSASSTKNTPPPAILRPSELYFEKLTPLLSKHNIKATQSNRKEWPLQVLKEVLSSLTGMYHTTFSHIAHIYKFRL